FLYQGFNADEDGRRALDGVLAHVAGAGRGSFNYRFAQPSRDAQPTSKIFFSNTSYEYWGRAAALIHVDPEGKQDAPIADNVRIYHFTGLQHFSGPFPPRKGAGDLLGQQAESALPIQFFWRAMLTNMDAWVRNGTLPPNSSYPRIDNGTLVSLRDYAFPPVPELNRPAEANEAERLDFGPQW